MSRSSICFHICIDFSKATFVKRKKSSEYLLVTDWYIWSSPWFPECMVYGRYIKQKRQRLWLIWSCDIHKIHGDAQLLMLEMSIIHLQCEEFCCVCVQIITSHAGVSSCVEPAPTPGYQTDRVTFWIKLCLVAKQDGPCGHFKSYCKLLVLVDYKNNISF